MTIRTERPIKAGAKVCLQKRPVDNAQSLAIIRQTLREPEQPGDSAVTGNWKLFA